MSLFKTRWINRKRGGLSDTVAAEGASPVVIRKADVINSREKEGYSGTSPTDGAISRTPIPVSPSPTHRKLEKSLSKKVLTRMTSFNSLPTTSSPAHSITSFSREGSLAGSMTSLNLSEDDHSVSDLSVSLSSQNLSSLKDSMTSQESLNGSETPNAVKKKKGIFKLPFSRKTKTPKSNRRGSHAVIASPTMLEVPQPRQSRSHSLTPDGAPQQVGELERIKEDNHALKYKVSQKKEELKMLNASIDMMNTTWEQKVRALQRNVDKQKLKNQMLQSMIEAEANPQSSKTPKRIAVNRDATKVSNDVTEESSEKSLESVSRVSPAKKQVVKKKVTVDLTKKTDDVIYKLKKVLMDSKHFKHLSSTQIQQLVDAIQCRKITTGERLMKEGTSSKCFYILVDGECRTYKETDMTTSLTFDEASVPVKSWTLFGEAGVFYKSLRMISCKCTKSGLVWFLSQQHFHQIAQQDLSRREIFNFFRRMKSFKNFGTRELKQLAHVCKVEHYSPGHYVIREGDDPDSVYIIKEGAVRVTRQIDGTENLQKTLRVGYMFGNADSTGGYTSNFVAANSDVVQCIVMSMMNYDEIKMNITLPSEEPENKEMMEDTKTTSSRTSGYSSSSGSTDSAGTTGCRYDAEHRPRFNRIQRKLRDKRREAFNYIATIGHGAFGTVDLVSTKSGDYDVFAIKKLSNKEIIASELQYHVENEIRWQMQASLQCPFIASLYSSFEDSRFHYFVMEYCPGGELFTLLKSMDQLDDASARFYIACVVEALAYLHWKRIVFRDLKPENIVIDRRGYCKLTDFGFAKLLSSSSGYKTYTMCGTPEYTSPETILGKAQTFTADIWALGVLIYELLVGKAPFLNKHRKDLDDLILGGIEPRLEIKSASHLTPDAVKIITELCQLRAEERLGSGKPGMDDVTKHQWFNDFDWLALRQRTMTPPWVPKLRSAQDTVYFDCDLKKKDKNDNNEVTIRL